MGRYSRQFKEEAIKLVTGVGTPLIGRLLVYDAREARFSEIGY